MTKGRHHEGEPGTRRRPQTHTIAIYKKIAPRRRKKPRPHPRHRIQPRRRRATSSYSTQKSLSPYFKVFYNPGVGLENKYDVYARHPQARQRAHRHAPPRTRAPSNPKPSNTSSATASSTSPNSKTPSTTSTWGGWMIHRLLPQKKATREKSRRKTSPPAPQFLHDHFPE